VIERVARSSELDLPTGCVYAGRVNRVVSAMLLMLAVTTGCTALLSTGEEQSAKSTMPYLESAPTPV
jgi:hypothetical protein